MTDWTILQPFAVIWCSYHFDGDPDPQLKYFIVARNLPEMRVIHCFKPTSRTRYYDAEPLRLSGIVEYGAGEVETFTAERTIIDPEKAYLISYDVLRNCELQGSFRSHGMMPPDFCPRMVAAVKAKKEWRQAARDAFFKWFPAC